MSNDHGESGITPTESETTGMVGNFPHGSRDTPGTFAPRGADRSEKARSHTTDMYVPGESDSSIVPKKPANNDSVPLSAELVEGRELTKENAAQSLPGRTQSRALGSRGLFGVREAARHDQQMRFNNLLSHVTPELLRASFFQLKKQAAPGVGEWRVVPEHSGHAARGGDLTALCERVSALRSGPLDGGMAETTCPGQSDHRALRG